MRGRSGSDEWVEIVLEGVGRIPVAIRVKSGPHLAERLAAELAEQQDGPLSRRQLLALDLTEGQVERWVRSGRLRQIYRGVYAYGHKRLRLEGWLRAALLACGLDSALSHGTGAGWLCLREGFPSRPELSGPRTGRNGPPNLTYHRPRLLLPEDTVLYEGLPVTSVARTLLDLAATEAPERVRQAIGKAQKQGLFDANTVRAVLERNRGHRGRKRLDTLIAGFRPAIDLREELERRFHALMAKATDLPPYKPNYPFGPYLLDAFFEEHRLAVELDGYGTHHDVATFVGDRQRDRYLLLNRINNIRFTWWDVDRAPATLRQLLSHR